MLSFIIGFLAMAIIPLLLAGYGGHLATMVLEKENKRKALSIIWGLAILGILASGFYQWLNDRMQVKSRFIATPHPIPKIYGGFKNVVLRVGTDYFLLDIGRPKQFSSQSPGTFEMTKEGEVLLEIELRDQLGRIVATVHNSEVRLSNDNYDVNADKNAVEIVDGNLKPILQIYKLPPDVIEKITTQLEHLIQDWKNHQMPVESWQSLLAMVQGQREMLQLCYFSYLPQEIKNATRIAICDQQGCTEGDILDVEKRRENLKRMFVYPGYSNYGVRIK